MEFLDLPEEIVSLLGRFLEITDLTSLLSTCKTVREYFDGDELLWEYLYRRDFNVNRLKPEESWQANYQLFYSVRFPVFVAGADDAYDVLNGLLSLQVNVKQYISFENYGSVKFTLEDFQRCRCVFTWSDSDCYSGDAFGDALADYVDLGGAVVLLTFATCSNLRIGGRFDNQNYSPLELGVQQEGKGHQLVIKDASSPLMRGITTVDAVRGYRGPGRAIDGATVVATYDDDHPFVLWWKKGCVVVLNFLPKSSRVRGSEFWDVRTDGWQLMQNAIHFACVMSTPQFRLSSSPIPDYFIVPGEDTRTPSPAST